MGVLYSSVVVATGYGLVCQGSNPGTTSFFLFVHSTQSDSRTHPVTYPMGTGDDFPGGKAAGE
jgi:hypothetical protein